MKSLLFVVSLLVTGALAPSANAGTYLSTGADDYDSAVVSEAFKETAPTVEEGQTPPETGDWRGWGHAFSMESWVWATDFGAENEPAPICHADHSLALGFVFDVRGTGSGEAEGGAAYIAAGGYEWSYNEWDYPGLHNIGREHSRNYDEEDDANRTFPIGGYRPTVWNPYAVDIDGDGDDDGYGLTVEDEMWVGDGLAYGLPIRELLMLPLEPVRLLRLGSCFIRCLAAGDGSFSVFFRFKVSILYKGWAPLML